MAEEGRIIKRSSPGLAVLLSGDDPKGKSPQRPHMFSCYDGFNHQSVERTLEYIFDLPHKSLHPFSKPIDVDIIRSVLKSQLPRFQSHSELDISVRDGVKIIDVGCGADRVIIDNASVCGELKVVREPSVIESFGFFSSARANACVWNGKWMYEVTLETCGVQQLGWATVSCPFTDRKGVGDAEDSYAFDGKRVSIWNKDSKAYGQPWVIGDIIGCCIDLDTDTISFYRNGVSLGVAYKGITRMAPGLGYYPAISLSECERCDLNFGSRPFKYPICGFQSLHASPKDISYVSYLLRCLLRLLDSHPMDKSDTSDFEKLRTLKRFPSLQELFLPISCGICEELFSVIATNQICEYAAWGVVLSFFLDVFRMQVPHDFASWDRVLDIFLEFSQSSLLFQHVISALASRCKVSPLVLTDCPYSGSYPYLALACHMLRREKLMIMWWNSLDFEFSLEGFLSRKCMNKHDLQCIMPSVWLPESPEIIGSENSMTLTTTALSGAVNKIEEMHQELCRIVIHFIPPSAEFPLHGSVFRTFVQNFILRVRGDHNVSTSAIPSNASLISLFTVILHFLSEGFAMSDLFGQTGSKFNVGTDGSFLHKPGNRSFPLRVFTDSDPYRNSFRRLGGSFSQLSVSHPLSLEESEVSWEEGCMDDECSKVTHSSLQRPCCCSTPDDDSIKIFKDHMQHVVRNSRCICSTIPDRQTHVSECHSGNLNDEIMEKASSSDLPVTDFEYTSLKSLGSVPMVSHLSSEVLLEQELLDVMLLLYHIGVAPNFRQAFYYMAQQSLIISLLDETDKQIREKPCSEQLKRLREARAVYHEELVDCVRQCAWYRISLFSRWKQRGMYAACMWVAQLLLVLGHTDSTFLYIPEFYLESLVDSFHALRRSDPPFVSSTMFLKNGLASFVSFVTKHFSDTRILSADIRDLLLQSISVLVQYKDYLHAFEVNKEAIDKMPRALLLAFDNRTWIPVTNILLRFCEGSGFGIEHAKYPPSIIFQDLLRKACLCDEVLFACFLNRLFNTLSWTMTECAVSMRDLQEGYQSGDAQLRKYSVIFNLSCNLSRILEFWTREIPQAFLLGSDMNLRRSIEIIIFILNHIVSIADPELLDMSLRRPGQHQEKMSHSMMLAPLVGIILNLMDASADSGLGDLNNVIDLFAIFDYPLTVHWGLEYLLSYDWASILKGNSSLGRLARIQEISIYLKSQTEGVESRESCSMSEFEDNMDSCCCICYACKSDALFEPCHHNSCMGCITRHLLNSQRCFFCNTTITVVVQQGQAAI